jgi:hypothetical protein
VIVRINQFSKDLLLRRKVEMLLVKRLLILMILASLFMWGCGEDGPTEPPIPPNKPPEITKITTSINEDELLSGETVRINVEAHDPDGDSLTYSYKLDGAILPGSACSTDFVAPSVEGTHTVFVEVRDTTNASVDSSIEITVCNSVSFGLYSEGEHCNIVLDENGSIGLYYGGGAQVIEFEDDPNEKWEGTFGKKVKIDVGPTGEWAGWFVMYGKEGTPDSHNRDMLLFDGGSLRFCIKSEIDNLIVSIRSDGVTPGKEHRVFLSQFSNFKVGEWSEISISLVLFTEGWPKADLNQLKILFNIASCQESGGTNGVQSFWIDNVRLVRSGY